MKINWKSWLPNAIILLVFVLAGMVYFWPAVQGKIIYAGDGINGRAAVEEAVRYHEETGDYSWWTGSMFSGMPNYQIGGGGGFALDRILQPIRKFFSWGNRNTAMIFVFYLLAFFLLLRSFKVDKWLSMAGAFAIALSSYFFVIIGAAHHGKCYSITWMTLVIVGFLLTYRKQYGWGALLVMFFTYIGFFLHPQMSYYICMMIGILFFAELAQAWKAKAWKHFGIATAVFAVSFVVGMGMGSANIFANQEYAEETMRGGHSDLEKVTDESNKTKGLDLDYATAWSYGIDETMTFLIPNYMGGCSGYNLGKDSQLEQDLRKMGVPSGSAKKFCQSAPTYRGEKAFTSGPVYMGAIICFLFLLGLLIVSGPYKWALLVATLFSVFLAWGHHFMPLTELFFKYFPMYNKFRAVESILIVAEITIPLLGMLALKAISDGSLDWKRLRNSICISGGITAAICLLVAIFVGTIDVTSSYDAQWKGQVGEQIYAAILDQRTAMIRSDAWRSLLFVVLGVAVTFAYAYARYKKDTVKNLNLYAGITLCALIVADMWTVDKRFCNDSYFQPKKDVYRAFKILPYEEELQKDESHFRVLNLATNTFNEARTSYYLKSIGGYSAAKLRRYQDLIDVHIAPEMNPLMQAIMQTNGFMQPCNGDSIFPVLNMLNMKYAIVPLQNGSQVPVQNPYAMGNCWFVDSLLVVDNANDEIAALSQIDLHTTAVVDKAFADVLEQGTMSQEQRQNGSIDEGLRIQDERRNSTGDAGVSPAVEKHCTENSETNVISPSSFILHPSSRISLTKYTPHYIEYHAENEHNKIAVFSEIYYPHGWKLYLLDKDGNEEKELSLARVNYMLRAAVIPAGTHNLRMVFEPESVRKGNILSLVCFAIMLLTLCGVVGYEIYTRRRKKA